MHKSPEQISQQRQAILSGKNYVQGAAVELTTCGDFDNAAKLNMALQLIDSVAISLELQQSTIRR